MDKMWLTITVTCACTGTQIISPVVKLGWTNISQLLKLCITVTVMHIFIFVSFSVIQIYLDLSYVNLHLSSWVYCKLTMRLTPSCFDSSAGRALHQYLGGSGLEPCLGLNCFFSGKIINFSSFNRHLHTNYPKVLHPIYKYGWIFFPVVLQSSNLTVASFADCLACWF